MTLAHSAVYVSGFMCGIVFAIYMHNMYPCAYRCINKSDRSELCAPHNTHLSTTLNKCIDLILTRRSIGTQLFFVSTSGHSRFPHICACIQTYALYTSGQGECHRHRHIVFGTDIPHTHKHLTHISSIKITTVARVHSAFADIL